MLILSDHSELAFNKNILFKGVNGKKTKIDVWMSHGDKVVKLPKQFKKIASSTNSKIAAFASDDKQRFGVQFHPEVSHTDQGLDRCETPRDEIAHRNVVYRPKRTLQF